jgi:hypothetical protein
MEKIKEGKNGEGYSLEVSSLLNSSPSVKYRMTVGRY